MDRKAETMERMGQIEDHDRSFDREYWRRQGADAIFAAAWAMVEEHYERTTGNSAAELRLQRSVERFQRQER